MFASLLRNRRRASDSGSVEHNIPSPEAKWFDDHWSYAADTLIEFLGAEGISLEGATVADIGSGDGIIAAAVATKAKPKRLVAYDIGTIPGEWLADQLRKHVGIDRLPKNLELAQSSPTEIPAFDDAFDVITSWSAFEHIADPIPLLADLRRVLKPNGAMFIQLWPFFNSEHGSHMWSFFPDSFIQFRHNQNDVEELIKTKLQHDPVNAERMLHEYRILNRITLDELHRSLLAGGFTVARVELMTHTFQLTPDLNRYPLSELATAGVQLIATPAR